MRVRRLSRRGERLGVRPLLGLLLIVPALLFVAGCGGSDDSDDGTSSSDTTAAAGGGGVEEAKEFVAEHTANPPSIFQTESLKNPPPDSGTLVYMACALPVCQTTGAATKEAADTLGWDYKELQQGETPESIKESMESAVQLKPTIVTACCMEPEIVQRQLDQLEDLGIPFVDQSSLAPVGENGVVTSVQQADAFITRGVWLANWIAADTDGDANVVMLNIPNYPVLKLVAEGLEEELGRVCPSCELDEIAVTPKEVGSTLPSRVVSYLQQNPDVNYIAGSPGDVMLGVPTALKGAGLDEQVKSISQGVSPPNLEAIINEEIEVAGVPESLPVTAWASVDAGLRALEGSKINQEEYANGPTQYLVKDNIKDPEEPYIGVLDYQEQFKQLWGL